MNRWKKTALASGIILVALAAVLAAAIRLPAVHQYAIKRANQALQGGDIAISATQTKGAWPWKIEAAQLTIAQAGQDLLVAENVSLSWRPLLALRGRYDIRSLDAASLTVRLPQAGDQSNTEETNSLPTLPDLRVGHLGQPLQDFGTFYSGLYHVTPG